MLVKIQYIYIYGVPKILANKKQIKLVKIIAELYMLKKLLFFFKTLLISKQKYPKRMIEIMPASTPIFRNADSLKNIKFFTEFSVLPNPYPNGFDNKKSIPFIKLLLLSAELASLPDNVADKISLTVSFINEAMNNNETETKRIIIIFFITTFFPHLYSEMNKINKNITKAVRQNDSIKHNKIQ